MTNQRYDSITARCFHIWITITVKDCHPSYHGRGLSPSDYCLLHLQVESDNRLHLQSDYYGRGCHPRIMASCNSNWNLTTVCTRNRITAEVYHSRIMASCICKLNLTTVCTCNRITAEVCHPRIIASCTCNWNLTTVCTCNRITAEVCHPRIMASCICKLNLTNVCTCNRITTAESDNDESQL